tara:strand:+ start:2236 stop:3453 length:1218 start_codon:yes stop_codon:yes gene_type:complete
MFSFKGFFTQDKNTHLEHLEDDIINNGAKGGDNAINFLKSVRNMLAGNTGGAVNMTVKWDGAPAIICGTNPENGKFFVGTKSVFNKTPKINYSIADIRKNHGTTGAGAKLIYCFNYLKRLPIKGILQGDLLFTDDKTNATIDGETMITFTPNTITYAVPADSGIGRQINRAKMGIVFHTSYTGKDMKSLSAGFGTVRGSGGSNIFLASAQYTDKSGSVKFNKRELSVFDAQIRMAEGSLSKAGPMLNEMSKTTSDQFSVGFRLKTFFNHFIKTTQGNMGKVRDMQKRFETYYENTLDNEIASKKTDRGKAPYIKAKKDGMAFIKRNRTALYFAIASHITLANCKNTLLRKMNQIQSIGHFVRTSNGYRVTAPEGYVAVDRVAGAVKLVDRLEFSRTNFTLPKGWN